MTQYLFVTTAGKPEYGAEEIDDNVIVVDSDLKEQVARIHKVVVENDLDHAAIAWSPEIYHLPYGFVNDELILDQKSIGLLEQHDPVLLEIKEELIQEKLEKGNEEVNEALNLRYYELEVYKNCWCISFRPKYADFTLETATVHINDDGTWGV
jgi:hypothetical protein